MTDVENVPQGAAKPAKTKAPPSPLIPKALAGLVSWAGHPYVACAGLSWDLRVRREPRPPWEGQQAASIGRGGSRRARRRQGAGARAAPLRAQARFPFTCAATTRWQFVLRDSPPCGSRSCSPPAQLSCLALWLAPQRPAAAMARRSLPGRGPPPALSAAARS